MPRSSNQNKSVSTVQPTIVTQVADLLGDLPDKPTSQPEQPTAQRSLKEVVAQLLEPIQGALAKGYTHQEIADLMGQYGFSTTAETLKSYLHRTRRQTAPQPAKGTKKVAQTKSPQTTSKTEPKSTEAATSQESAQAEAKIAPVQAKAETAPPAPKQKPTPTTKTTKSRTSTTARKSAAKSVPAAKTTARKRKTT